MSGLDARVGFRSASPNADMGDEPTTSWPNRERA
jgi:hypothetical protein